LRLGIVVEFNIKHGHLARFLELIAENARLSADVEPGCLQFDVLQSSDQADRVLLYEIYSDEAAFEAHLQAPHFLEFDLESASLFENKTVRHFTLTTSNVHPMDDKGLSE
jgi:autoinducer 2-degrading protein